MPRISAIAQTTDLMSRHFLKQSIRIIVLFLISPLGLICGGLWYYESRFPKTPCIAETQAIAPLVVGTTALLKVNSRDVSDSGCPEPWGMGDRAWVWAAQNPDVATVSPDGMSRGIAPGEFEAIARRDGDRTTEQRLKIRGVVYPQDWKAKITPEQLTVRVGDRVKFELVGYDANGQKLPPVHVSLRTSEAIEHPELEPLQSYLLNQSYMESNSGSVALRAIGVGTTTITGAIANQRVQATLTIRPKQN
jgi:hypothetical protein